MPTHFGRFRLLNDGKGPTVTTASYSAYSDPGGTALAFGPVLIPGPVPSDEFRTNRYPDIPPHQDIRSIRIHEVHLATGEHLINWLLAWGGPPPEAIEGVQIVVESVNDDGQPPFRAVARIVLPGMRCEPSEVPLD